MCNLSDEELFALYYEANNMPEGKHPSISTSKIFIAMKAAISYGRKQALIDAMFICNENAISTTHVVNDHVMGFEAGSSVCRDEIEELLNKIRHV
jgi:hypothetical protein